MSRMTGSPLGCCNPKEERQMISPVFRQQYVNENGKMKLTMPISPLHYITNSGYLANDYRMPQNPIPWEVQQMPYPHMYEHQLIQMDEHRGEGGVYTRQGDKPFARRVPTSNINFAQHGRQASVQLSRNENGAADLVAQQQANATKANEPNLKEINEALARIEEQLRNLESLCRSNETGILKVLRTLLGTDKRSESKEEEQPNVPKTMSSMLINSEGSIVRRSDCAEEKMQPSISVASGKSSLIYSKDGSISVTSDKVVKKSDMASFGSGYNQGTGQFGSSVFDVSQELKQTNDILEKFLSGSESFNTSEEGDIMQHENIQKSIMGKKDTGEFYSEDLALVEDVKSAPANEKPKKRTDNVRTTSLEVKPVVTTTSMATEEIKHNAALENLEKRFQLMLNTIDHINNGAKKTLQKGTMPQMKADLMAIGNENIGTSDQFSSYLATVNNEALMPTEGQSFAGMNNGDLAEMGGNATVFMLNQADALGQINNVNQAHMSGNGVLISRNQADAFASMDNGDLAQVGTNGTLVSRNQGGSIATMGNAGLSSIGGNGTMVPLSQADALATMGNSDLAQMGGSGTLVSRNQGGSIATMGNAGLSSIGGNGTMVPLSQADALATMGNSDLAQMGGSGTLVSRNQGGSIATMGNGDLAQMGGSGTMVPMNQADALATMGNGDLSSISSKGTMVPMNQADALATMGNGDIANMGGTGTMVPRNQGDALVPMRSGQVAVRNSSGELVQAEYPPLAEDMAAKDHSRMVMGKYGAVTSNNGGNMPPHIESIVDGQEYDATQTHQITCSLIHDESEEDTLPRLDSIRGLNTTIMD